MKTLREDLEARISLEFVPPCGPFQVTTKATDGTILSRTKRASKRLAESLFFKAQSAHRKASK